MSKPHAKSVSVRIKSAGGVPDEGQLAAIRSHTLRDFTADELVVREFVIAHNAIDRDKECFSPPLLADFARTLPGKGVFIRHPNGWDGDTGPGEGKVFAASTERMTHDEARALLREPSLVFPPDQLDAVLAKAWAYYVKTPENVAFLLKLDAGIAGEVSIGFSAKSPERLKDDSGLELNAYRWHAPGEAHEISHVWLGAQPGARATKSASRTPENATMDETQIKAMQTENERLKTEATKAADTTTLVANVRKALGTNAALLDSPDALAAAVNAGAAFRKSLVDDIVAAERQLGITGDTDEEVATAKSVYESLPVDKLDKIRKSYDARRPEGGGGSQLKGGDPNAEKPGAGGLKSAPADSHAANPAFV